MKKLLIIFIFFTLSGMCLAQQDYKSLHQQSLVVDMHTDVLLQVLRGADISQKLDYGHVDLVRLKEGGVDVQFFVLWPNPNSSTPDRMFEQTYSLLERLNSVIAENDDKVRLARSPQEILNITNDNKIAACIGIEGGTAIENSLDNLQTFFDRGVRYMGLTWEDSPDWATSAKDEYKELITDRAGLTDFGRDVIKKMNQLGMMVDISHSGEKTFWDVIETATKPVIASHSCVYNLRSHYRNLKDEQIKAIAEKGGVIFINFYPVYLDYEFTRNHDQTIATYKSEMDSIKKTYGTDRLGFRKYRNSFYLEKAQPYLPDLGIIVDHMDAIIELVGEDHVGLGSDFDGISITPKGLEHAGKMANLTKEMIERGYSEERIKKILGGNFMRVFKANIN
jgi:membrane dipeptidase